MSTGWMGRSGRVVFCFCLILAWSLHSGRGGDERLPRCNVLLIIADDLNTALSCYGHRLVKTPHIDRLARGGVLFDRAYCQYPLCNPTRASLLTGLRPDSTRVYGNGAHFRSAAPDVVTLPEHFRRHGYRTVAIGKVFHDGVPKGSEGLDDPRSWDRSVVPHGRENSMLETIESLIPGSVGGTLSWLADAGDEAELTDAVRAAAAVEFLEQHPREEAFFLAVGFYRPHTPFVAPQRYFAAYPPARIELPERPFEDRDDIPLAALRDKREQLSMTDDQRRSAVQAYYAATSFMDAQVGRLLDALERSGHSDNTIIVFFSDHGYHLGEHGLWQKQSLFEESARVPLVIAAPRSAGRGRACRSVVELVDLYPTLVELCGLPAPPHLEGTSLAGLLDDPAASVREEALTQALCATYSLARQDAPQGYSIRTADFRYTEWNRGREGVELYDHRRDAGERNNVAFDPAYAEAAAYLRRRLRQRVAESRGEPLEVEAPPKEAASEPWRIVVLGDSITKGVRSGVAAGQTFASLIAQWLRAGGAAVEVSNVGAGGDRTDGALLRLGRDVLARKPHLVTIMYGTNDSFVDAGQATSRLGAARYRANLERLVTELEAAGATPILMTEPCFADTHRQNGAGEHPNVRLERYMEICRQVARDSGTLLVDHFEYWTRQNLSGIDVGRWTTDGCHPNGEGHRQLALRMLPVVRAALEERRNAAAGRTPR